MEPQEKRDTQQAPLDPTQAERIEGVDSVELTDLEKRVIEALRTVYDPEIPVNIYELGLIYELKIDEEARHAFVKMTLTAPGCPVAGTFPDTVRVKVESVEGIDSCEVDLTFYPPWNPDLMSEAARLELGFF